MSLHYGAELLALQQKMEGVLQGQQEVSLQPVQLKMPRGGQMQKPRNWFDQSQMQWQTQVQQNQ